MPGLGASKRDTLPKQQFIEGKNPALKESSSIQQLKLSSGETVSAAQQLNLAIQFSSNNIESQISRATASNQFQP